MLDLEKWVGMINNREKIKIKRYVFGWFASGHKLMIRVHNYIIFYDSLAPPPFF